LVVDNPLLIDPEGDDKVILMKFDLVMTILFTLELVTKVIVFGFAVNGENSYMRNNWNLMDFVIVAFSLISIIFSDVDLEIFKLLRMLRVLRPLRMISRNPGLRIAI
jgi:membrane-anchored protein YejM (alkaline phosphatase superfamily)